jgi:hypothetical protein
MDPTHKKILKAIVLELRHLLEGWYDGRDTWHPGDLEQRLAAIGVRRDREPVPVDELPHLSDDDKHAREVVDAYLSLRREAGIMLAVAVAEFVRETAYTWANRLLALRCMEARELIDEVILQKEVYGGRSLEHHRLAQRQPELCTGGDDGLFAVLFRVFAERAETLPLLFDPKAAGVALKPTAAALKRCVALLSGTEAVNGQNAATNDVFKAADALGWAYQYWNTEEKDRVFEKVRTKKGAKIEGADIIAATQLYTEPYMVKFLVQNSLGATWVGMRPDTKLVKDWEYFVRDADRAPVENKPVGDITFLDPACGSGHFLVEAFDLFFAMYKEEGKLSDPEAICRSILENNLYGVDIDERAIQIAEAVLWMKAAEKAFDFPGPPTNLVATNIRLPRGKDHLREFLKKHPDDQPLRPALEVIFEGLEHADELGSLLQIEEPVEKELKHLKKNYEEIKTRGGVQAKLFEPTIIQGKLPLDIENYDDWRQKIVTALKDHFAVEAESADLAQAFFSQSAGRGLALFDLLAGRYDVVAANPPYMGAGNMGKKLKSYVLKQYTVGKRDLYAAFILRCCKLCLHGGRVAMVTMQGWMFQRYYCQFRYRQKSSSPDGILAYMTFETIAHLGSRAFDPETQLHDGVVVAMFVAVRSLVSSEDRFVAVRCLFGEGPKEKSAILRGVTEGRYNDIVFKPLQETFTDINEAPLMYWLSDPLLMLLASSLKVEEYFRCLEGIQTGKDKKYVRYFWEVGSDKKNWVPYLKGGGYRRWCGLEHFVVKWQHQGAELRNDPKATPPLCQ